MQSTSLYQDVIDEYLKQELGNILGPFPKATALVVHVNCFEVIPKKHQVGKNGGWSMTSPSQRGPVLMMG